MESLKKQKNSIQIFYPVFIDSSNKLTTRPKNIFFSSKNWYRSNANALNNCCKVCSNQPTKKKKEERYVTIPCHPQVYFINAVEWITVYISAVYMELGIRELCFLWLSSQWLVSYRFSFSLSLSLIILVNKSACSLTLNLHKKDRALIPTPFDFSLY